MNESNDDTNLGFNADEMKLITRMEGIFMPIARKQRDEFYKVNPTTGVGSDSARFVHYTSAEAALNIITSKRMWMRNAMSMSDYREVQHGYDILRKFFGDNTNTLSRMSSTCCLPL